MVLYLAFEYNRGGNIAHQMSEYFLFVTFCNKYGYNLAYVKFGGASAYFNEVYDLGVFHKHHYETLKNDDSIVNINCDTLSGNFLNECNKYKAKEEQYCIFCPIVENPNLISVVSSNITTDELRSTQMLYKGILHDYLPKVTNDDYICIHNVNVCRSGIQTDTQYFLRKYDELIKLYNVPITMPVYIFTDKNNAHETEEYREKIQNLSVENLTDKNVLTVVSHAKFFIASKTGISNIAHIFSNCMTFVVKDDWNTYYENKIYNIPIRDQFDELIDTDRIEVVEQDLVREYIEENDIILELGARYGSVSCVANKILRNKRNHIVVEPDERVWNALEKNKEVNRCEFYIIKGFISKHKLGLTNLDNCRGGYGSTSHEDADSNIISYTLEDITTTYELLPNVLIADCEGFLEQFFDENPNLYVSLNKVLFESDYPDKCNYDKIRFNLSTHGFVNVKTIGNQHVWIK